MFRKEQLRVRSWNQDRPPDERFTENYGDREFCRTTEVQRFSRRLRTASNSSSRAANSAATTLPKTCGDAAKGLIVRVGVGAHLRSLFQQKSSVLASFLDVHQRHHRSFLTRNLALS
jgi:hypothetical protein